MKKNLLKLFAALIITLPCCTSTSPAADLPAEMYFVSDALPNLNIPAEVGGRTENPADETGALRTAFRDAYMEALLRGVMLTGVLSSDRVNPWPASAPESWSQNWACAGGSPNAVPNSWGLPNLVLALGHYPALAGLSDLSAAEKTMKIAFTVHGPILDMYGKSAGYARANGIIGYGIPLGETTFSSGTAVQRFSRGRMIITGNENRFSFEDDLFYKLLENLTPEEMNKEFGGRNISQDITDAFAYAWAFAFSEKEKASDGPIARVTFSKPWILEAGAEKISVSGFYYKSYNNSQDVLVLLISEQLPFRVHVLSGSFLKTILSHKRLSGLKTERKVGAAAGSGLGKTLAEGFAIYGPPLSDPLPWPASVTPGSLPETAKSSGENPEAAFLEIQRFARGWMVVKPDSR